ncbi:MAG: hypothetical protein ACTSVI_15135 [Promethearchaeota archaeon]
MRMIIFAVVTVLVEPAMPLAILSEPDGVWDPLRGTSVGGPVKVAATPT